MRTRTVVLVVLLSALLIRHSAACLWTYATNLDGRVEEIESLPPDEIAKGLIDNRSRESWLAEAEKLNERAMRQPENHELRNDYAVMLVRAGELNEALAVLNDIEAIKPGLYPTAANLGTVYELSGDVEKALHWIKEGLARNPQSHRGSEWLHVRILQAKQEMAVDPDWLKSHSILGLNFGSEPRPTRPLVSDIEELHGPKDFDQLRDHLTYQLRERTSLVDPPDPIVGDLLFDLANLYALKGELENAVAVGKLAARYEPPHDGLLQNRLRHFEKIVNSSVSIPRLLNERISKRHAIAISFVVLISFIAIIAFALARWRRRQQNSSFQSFP